MVYGIPVEQLKERSNHLYEEASLNALHLQADAMYHDMCILAEKVGISRKHPAIEVVEKLYVEALQEEADGAPVTEVAYGILHATSKLQEILFADELL